jgi:endoglucanase Acf2
MNFGNGKHKRLSFFDFQHCSLAILITYPVIDAPNTAWYNDLHFHYGYHIYGAAVVANFDPEWGKQMFERVLLLVRNIANPTDDDDVFPAFRHKDWYQGHSWASGIVSPVFLNGRNQESSSEAIAAYESVTLWYVYHFVSMDILSRRVSNL